MSERSQGPPRCGAPLAARVAVLISLTASLNFASALPASAHPILVRSEPADGAVLDEPPEEILLSFGDDVAPELSGAEILDDEGLSVESQRTRIDPNRPDLLVVSVPKLADGVYTVAWRAFSEDDGHLLRGSLVFRVGAGLPPAAGSARPPPERLPSPAEVVLRWLDLVAIISVAGALAVAGWVLTPVAPGRGARDATRRARRRVMTWSALAAGAALVAGIGLLGHEVTTLAAGAEGGVPIAVAWVLLTGTRWGTLWLAREFHLIALLAALLVARRAERTDAVGWGRLSPALVVSGLLVVSLARVHTLAGHAAAGGSNTGLTVAAGTVHLLAAGVWIGGVLALLLAWQGERANRTGSGALFRAWLRRFGKLALPSVGLLAATGLYTAGQEVASLDALLTTVYGRALLGKTGLFLAAGAFGLANAILLHPRAARPLALLLRKPVGWTPLSVSRLRSLVLAEALLGVLVLAGASLLAASVPARGPRFEPTLQAVPTPLTRTVDDLLVSVSVKPNRPGSNVFEVLAASTRRPPPAGIGQVTLRLTSPEGSRSVTTPAMSPVDPGRYRLAGDFLSEPGRWRLEAVIERPGLGASVAPFDWSVGGAGPSRGVVSDAPLEPVLTRASAALLLMLAAGFAWLLLRHGPPAASAPLLADVPAAVEVASGRR